MTRRFDPITVPLAGVQLIEASAGTGKTFSIASLYLRLVLEQRLRVEQILVVTFTEAATAELHERIRVRLRLAAQAFKTGLAGEDPVLAHLLAASRDREADHRRLLLAITEIDQAAVSTIHGFCHRMLRQYGLQAGIPADLELTGNITGLVEEIADDHWVRGFHDLDPRLIALIAKKISHREFLSFCRAVARKIAIPLLGKQPDQTHIDAKWQAFLEKWGEARRVWHGERQEIEAAFAARSQGLTADFRRLLESGVLARMDGFFENEQPVSCLAPAGCEALRRELVTDPAGKVFTATGIKKGLGFDNPFFACWSALLASGDQLAHDCQRWFLAGAADWLRVELPRRLLAGQSQSFDDLLLGLGRVLAGEEGRELGRLIRARFPAALIDEFQDTDPVQYGIFRAVYGEGAASLFLIGDPKQAIYAFRGADIHAYLEAAASGVSARHTMAVNWRADPAMVAAVNRLFAGVDHPFIDPRIGFSPVSPRPGAGDLWRRDIPGHAPLQFLTLPEGCCSGRGGRLGKTELMAMIPELVAADIADLLAHGGRIGDRPVQAGDVAVLVRDNAQAEAFTVALRKRGIAAALQSRASVFASEEAGECLRLLAAILDPADEGRLRAALATVMLGYAATDLDRFNTADHALQELAARFVAWRTLWQRGGVMRLLLVVWQEAGVVERLLPMVDGERRLTNLRQLAELLRQAEEGNHLAPARLRDWLQWSIERGEAREEAELRLESDEQAVQLVTVHRSKGLEYGLVYCPYPCVGPSEARGEGPAFVSLHDPAAAGEERIALLPSRQEQRRAAAERFAEELRLLYVAITRARHGCMVLWAPMSGYDSSGLAMLLHGRNAGEPFADLEGWQAGLKQQSAEELLAALTALCASGNDWQVRPLAAPESTPWLDGAGNGSVSLGGCRTFPRTCDQVWRIGSFSHLIAAVDLAAPEQWEREESSQPEVGESPAGDAVALAHFPKGAAAGNFFHSIFENISFAKASAPEPLVEPVRQQLRSYGFSEESWLIPVVSALFEVLHTPLRREASFCLKDIGDRQRLNEMPFFVPVSGKSHAALTASQLAAPFRDHPDGLPRGYADSLASLRFVPLRGFLKGFVDLVFEHDGRWFLVDYKSNHLGPSRQDYGREQMAIAMAHHHYFLQYHLYCLALHRHLGARLPDYEYHRHFGGVFYLFIKGMHPESGPEFGVFHDLPPLARLSAISALLAGGNTSPAPPA